MIHDLTPLFAQAVTLVTRYKITLLLFGCAGLGAAGAWIIASLPFRKSLLDNPNQRSSHTIPTPRGAGVGILAAFIMAGLTLRIPTTFLLAALLISSVSFYGDYIRISVKCRFFFQAVSSFIFLFPLWPRLSTHYEMSAFGYSPFILMLILSLIFFFMIGTTNLYNFMDGINGIAGLSGFICFGLLGVFTLHRPVPDAFVFQTPLSLLSVGIALACLGYLPFNMPRARVFMGDVGSILLGFLFAGLVVILSRNYLEMVCFTALLFPFYADELTTMSVRLRDHENLTRSHRRHLYQLLANELGVAHWKISAAYGAAQLAIGLVILIACPYGMMPVFILLAVCFVSFMLLAGHIRRIADRSSDRGIPLPATGTISPGASLDEKK